MNKYLIFIGSLKKGGVERFAALLANHLVAKGDTVRLLMLKNEIAFDLDNRVEIDVIGYKKGGSKVVNILSVYFKLFFKVWIFRPKRLITLARISGLFASITFFPRTIVMFDIYPLIGYRKYKEYEFWFFYNLPWVKNVVSCSQELKDDVLKYFFKKDKIKVIPYPVPVINDNDYFKAEENLHKRPFFVVVSRLHWQKHVTNIIATYTKFEIYKYADLLILGDGPEMENLKKLVRNLQIAEHVHLMGFVRNPYPYIKASVCLINASMREGFPNVLVESLELRTPVISSLAKTGPKEIIFDGENGLLFKVNDYEKLGELMSRVILDKKFYAQLKKNTGKGLERFRHETVMKAWEKILN